MKYSGVDSGVGNVAFVKSYNTVRLTTNMGCTRHTLTAEIASEPKKVAHDSITPHGRIISCSL